MGEWQGVDTAGRKIAGLLGYTPPAGFYSRMQRAVEAMPEVIQTREIPGLLRKYPEGVPKWEISTVDVPSIVGDRKTIGRQELLDAVQQRSPVFTHGEVMLRDDAPGQDADAFTQHPLGQGQPSAQPLWWGNRLQDQDVPARDYTEILVTQPGANGVTLPMHQKKPDHPWQFGSHYGEVPEAVAHIRFARHGDAMRLHELQSDLANEKMRRKGRGWFQGEPSLDFPLEDAYMQMLLSRLAMQSARSGLRDIELPFGAQVAVASRGNRKNMRGLYDSKIPSAMRAVAKRLGGADEIRSDDYRAAAASANVGGAAERSMAELTASLAEELGVSEDEAYDVAIDLAAAFEGGVDHGGFLRKRAKDRIEMLLGWQGVAANGDDVIAKLAQKAHAAGADSERGWISQDAASGANAGGPRLTFRMSPEMMRNLLERGAPASVLGAAALQRGDE